MKNLVSNNIALKTCNEKITFLDIILILGLLFAPMTSLRIWKIGPSELLLSVWCIFYLFNSRDKRHKITFIIVFWLFFILLLAIGTVTSVIIMRLPTLDIGLIFTYLFFMFFILTLEFYYQQSSRIKIFRVLSLIFSYASLLYGILFLYSILFDHQLLGIELWYSDYRFSGGANNPHQFMYLSGPMIFVGLYIIKSRLGTKKSNILVITSILIYLIMSVAVKASTFLVVFVLQIFIFIMITFYQNKNHNKKIFRIQAMVIITSIILLVYYDEILKTLLQFISSDQNGLTRLWLWQIAYEHILISPITGWGLASSIAYLGFPIEAHNTVIEILLNTGLLGLINYMIYLAISFIKVRRNKYAIMILLFFFLYGLSGYSLRRIYYWYIISSVVYLEDMNKGNKNEKDKNVEKI